MADKVLLSTYVVTIEKKGIPQDLDSLKTDMNFLQLFESFCNSILKTIYHPKNRGIKNMTQALTLPTDDFISGKLKPINLDLSNNCIYGYFQGGTSGDAYDIANSSTRDKEFAVKPDEHITFKNIFYYLKTVPNKNEAYLILQRIRNFGIKTNLKNAFQEFCKKELEDGLLAQINNRITKEVFLEMLKIGNLKQIDFIKNSVPSTPKDLLNNNKQDVRKKGRYTQSVKMSGGFDNDWKVFISSIINTTTKSSTRIDFPDELESFDDISYDIESDGKKTKFHILNEHKTQPDVDVTSSIFRDKDNQPTLDSLIQVSEQLINEILEIKPQNVQ